jgi:hypothetical protein
VRIVVACDSEKLTSGEVKEMLKQLVRAPDVRVWLCVLLYVLCAAHARAACSHCALSKMSWEAMGQQLRHTAHECEVWRMCSCALYVVLLVSDSLMCAQTAFNEEIERFVAEDFTYACYEPFVWDVLSG